MEEIMKSYGCNTIDPLRTRHEPVMNPSRTRNRQVTYK